MLLNPNLLRTIRDDLRQASIGGNLSGHANLLVFVIVLGLPKLAAIVAPDHDGEDLIRERFVEIKKVGWPFDDSVNRALTTSLQTVLRNAV